MVHRIFKGMVLKTNCKNLDLDLLKRYNTIFAIRHLSIVVLIQDLINHVSDLRIQILVNYF